MKLRPLKRRKEIQHLWEQGQRLTSAMMTVVVLYREGENKGDVGYVVSVPRRRVRQAVERNRLRRLMRAALCTAVKQMQSTEGDIPFRAVGLVWRGSEEKPVKRLRLWDILPQVRELLRRAWEGCL